MDSGKSNRTRFNAASLWTLFLLIAAVLFLWGLLGWGLYANYYSKHSEAAGHLGDTFGVINSLFSGLAFAGLFFTILLQKKELEETRNEFKQQNITLRKQRFENTFFHLLTAHHELLNTDARANPTLSRLPRRRAFEHFIESLSNKLSFPINQNTTDYLAPYQEVYEGIYSEFFDVIDPYIYSIDAILKFTDNSDLLIEEKEFYYSIVNSQLTPDERTILQYHSKLSLARKPDVMERVGRLVKPSGRTVVSDYHTWIFSET